MHQLTVVKVGGKIVEDPQSLKTFLKDFSLIAGNKILVHGGGVSATQLAEKLGIKSPMVDGRRITDAETLKVVTMVYAGLVNKNIVAHLQALSLDAVGLTGADMNLIFSIKRPVKDIDYGYVGDVREVNAPVLKELLNQNYVPVIAPITHDGNGQLLNTNADTIAGETAKALAYDFNVRLIYCFDKKGVLLDEKDENSMIQLLTKEEFLQYKEEGIIKDGMIPKLENAFETLASGVKEVILLRASNLNTGEGTYIKWN
ncbi:acetylglutamate kinase [Bacteroidia bacterium]|nr:acetylglutamate kinase [Bacteroidia bacterium]GHT48200.1 acetylglutamate kinase [Bacteroidia bacterium]